MIPAVKEFELPRPDPGPDTVARTSVVVVDDAPDFRWVVRRALERSGEFTVVAEASDGATCVQVVVVHRPDVVLLDIEMPEMDGLEALAHLSDLCPETKVVMLTAMSPGAKLDAALAGGAVGIIRKGSSTANMLAQLRGLLELAPTHQIEIEEVH